MSEFVFLYVNGEPPATPEQAQQMTQRWMTWMHELAESGHLKDRGVPLERTGKVVSGTTSKTVTDGPFAEKDIVSGFSLILAKDIDEAVECSLGCPIFSAGGAVEVRPVRQLTM